ncbi:conserved hypothetical protein [Pediculus humanus corporis]|uniref:Uncharacterized protein n=1 Tax=Pediculus humanus subsp. corporis TaxID=121224 RepID=E0W003_PEDHC|nr:uncharacterized protein Phum_PHUM541120 [Pediculus humanus corporis]EEB18959.1 conserved hypothetical protein [Pediculus humanus corporis]
MGNALNHAVGSFSGNVKNDNNNDNSTVGENSGEHEDSSSNFTSVEAIVDKLSEVTNLAEQLDATINVAQAEGLNTSSTVTPNTKQLLDGTSSTSPEEWYANLKSPKTPNTSSDSKSEEEFLTASECTCTPPSRSSSFQTASEGGGAMSPWWELDTASDSEGKTKTESSSETVKRVVKSPIRIIEIAADELQPEETTDNPDKTDDLRPQPCSDINSKKLLRPDMASQIITEAKFPESEPCAHEIVKHLTEIVNQQESLNASAAAQGEQSFEPEIHKPETKYEGDTSSSQYSLELLNSELNLSTPRNNHSQSQSFETDNTDLSLPKFNAEISSDFTPEVPKFDQSFKMETYYRTEKTYAMTSRRDFSLPQKFISDESSKIYLIDASTPSPKSKRYVDSSLDSLELYQQPVRKIVEAEIHQRNDDDEDGDGVGGDTTKSFIIGTNLNKEEEEEEEVFDKRVKEVRERRKPITTIEVQNAGSPCASPPDYHYQSQIAKMAIKGVF